jgi:hypothetical protein
MRRPDAEWMDRADDVILEFLLNSPCDPLNATPGVIEANIDYSESTCKSRCRVLEQAGLLEYYDEERGIYSLSKLGVRYLNYEMDEAELASLDPSKPDDEGRDRLH